MLKGVERFIATQKIHPWQQKIFANQPLCNSAASFSSSSSSSRRKSQRNYYLRKTRKWPTQPFKKHMPDFLAYQLAKKFFKQSIKKSNAHLLSDLTNAFAAYEIQPSPQSYHLLFKILIQNHPSNFRDQILQVLDHIEKFENFEAPGCIFVDLINFYGENDMFDDAVELFSTTPRFRCEPSGITSQTLNLNWSLMDDNKFLEQFIDVEIEAEKLLLGRHELVEIDRMRNGNREALTALRKRAKTTQTSVPSPFESLMRDIDPRPLVKEVCTTCGHHNARENTLLMFPGTDTFATIPFHAAHTILEEEQAHLDFDSKKLQSFVKEQSLIISEKGALSDKIGPGVLKSLVNLTDKPKTEEERD